jgi:hypothetical protein
MAPAAAADGAGREEEGARDDDEDDDEDLSLPPPDDDAAAAAPRVPTIAARSQAEASQASSTGRQPIYMYCARTVPPRRFVSFHALGYTGRRYFFVDTAMELPRFCLLVRYPRGKVARPTAGFKACMAASRVLPLSGFGYRPRAYVLLFRVRKWPDGAVRPPYDVPAGRLLVPGFVRCARSSPFPGTYRGKRPTSI